MTDEGNPLLVRQEWSPEHSRGRIDLTRTVLQDRFFKEFPSLKGHDLIAAIDALELDPDAAASTSDAWLVYSGSVYWILFLKGFLEFEAAGELTSTNTHLAYLRRYYGPRHHDPGLEDVFSKPEKTRVRVLRRYGDFAIARHHAGSERLPDGLIQPVIVNLGEQSPQALIIYDVAFDGPAPASTVDGWHRVFAASVWGVQTLDSEYRYPATVD